MRETTGGSTRSGGRRFWLTASVPIFFISRYFDGLSPFPLRARAASVPFFPPAAPSNTCQERLDCGKVLRNRALYRGCTGLYRVFLGRPGFGVKDSAVNDRVSNVCVCVWVCGQPNEMNPRWQRAAWRRRFGAKKRRSEAAASGPESSRSSRSSLLVDNRLPSSRLLSFSFSCLVFWISLARNCNTRKPADRFFYRISFSRIFTELKQISSGRQSITIITIVIVFVFLFGCFNQPGKEPRHSLEGRRIVSIECHFLEFLLNWSEFHQSSGRIDYHHHDCYHFHFPDFFCFKSAWQGTATLEGLRIVLIECPFLEF